MPLRRPPHATLDALLRRELIRVEDPGTAALLRDLAAVRARGGFTRIEFLRMCRWKSPRARHLWSANPPGRIRAVSRRVLATRDEQRRMELLTGLRGVGVPMGSAILTLIDPRRYGVLDIRCWQLLFAMRSVTTNRRGQGFTVGQWIEYLDALRQHARRLRVSARTIESTLFHAHRDLQRGLLYERVRTERTPRGGGRPRGRPSGNGRARRPPGAGRG